jgi:hypothetical protein
MRGQAILQPAGKRLNYENHQPAYRLCAIGRRMSSTTSRRSYHVGTGQARGGKHAGGAGSDNENDIDREEILIGLPIGLSLPSIQENKKRTSGDTA